MLEIVCPNCKEISKVFLQNDKYKDPFRCWKCKAIFMVEIENNCVKSAITMSQEDFENHFKLMSYKKLP